MKRIILYTFAALLCLTSCNRSSKLLPNISGKAGEVLAVISKNDWDGSLGESLRDVLEDEYPYLPITEPAYTLTHVTHEGFIEMFQVHRNIIFFDINPQVAKPGVTIVRDRWSAPQIIINIAAYTSEEAESLFKENSKLIVSAIEQAERDRVVSSTKRYQNLEVAQKLEPVFGGSVKVPSGYKLRKMSHDFAWIEYNTAKYSQGIFIYRYPVRGDDLSTATIIKRRNDALKANAPGPDEGSYLTTASYWQPTTEYVRYKGHEFASTHGQWEVEGVYMGGPFVSHNFYSPDGSEVIVLDAWVYAPQSNKRQLFRQVESILYTWEWAEEK